MTEPPRVIRVGVERVLPLRHAVLRPGRPFESARMEGDDGEHAVHLAVLDDSGEIGSAAAVACGSVMPEAPSGTPESWVPEGLRGSPWRIRGMAVAATGQGRGLGTEILAGLLDAARDAGAGWVWCASRLRAENLYVRAGMVRHGGEWDIPGIGPHRFFVRAF
ncbi:MAG: GNAT family N-acetyltransferase [Planctomycetota bacterium]